MAITGKCFIWRKLVAINLCHINRINFRKLFFEVQQGWSKNQEPVDGPPSDPRGQMKLLRVTRNRVLISIALVGLHCPVLLANSVWILILFFAFAAAMLNEQLTFPASDKVTYFPACISIIKVPWQLR